MALAKITSDRMFTRKNLHSAFQKAGVLGSRRRVQCWRVRPSVPGHCGSTAPDWMGENTESRSETTPAEEATSHDALQWNERRWHLCTTLELLPFGV